jgi:cytochrome c556
MMKHRVVAASLAVLLGSAVMDAAAQAKPEVLVKQRQAAMTLLGKYFGPLGGMAQGKVPFNKDVVARNAEYLVPLSKMPWDGFDPSTANEKSRAKPELFKEMDKVKAGVEKFQSEVEKLASVAKSGDEAAIKSQIAAVGKTCGGCHDSYREKK